MSKITHTPKGVFVTLTRSANGIPCGFATVRFTPKAWERGLAKGKLNDWFKAVCDGRQVAGVSLARQGW